MRVATTIHSHFQPRQWLPLRRQLLPCYCLALQPLSQDSVPLPLRLISTD
uniref:Uncharacterized protein n=1 Tax=Rhizophora mucronata TaxID=61149 RepID=A0A2P2NMF5_RHIMU